VIAVRFDAIPLSMRLAPERWNVWRLETPRGQDKPTKVPYQLSGRKAASTRASEWTSFPDAAAFQLRMHNANGLAFRLGGGWAGVDIDACRDAVTGEVSDAAVQIIERFGTYGEVSPSGTGVKLFLHQPELPGVRTRVDNPYPGIGRIEMYTVDRFFTVTGAILDGVPQEVM
jgi:putative DNA primase/helicase